MNNDIYHIDFTAIFPTALQHDPKMLALAKGIAAEALAVSGHLNDVLIYSRFDELPEELVDILAYDMHVDWYDYDMPLKIKREVVKNSVKVHKYMGTKYAVETALGAVFPGASVTEWFEYGGTPYCFKINIPIIGESISEDQQQRGIRQVWFYKNLRSHLEGIVFTMREAPTTLHVGGTGGILSTMGIPEDTGLPEARPSTVHIGGTGGILSNVGIPEDTELPEAQPSTVQAGGTGGILSTVGLPEDTGLPGATTILRTGGVCTIISNLSGRSD